MIRFLHTVVVNWCAWEFVFLRMFEYVFPFAICIFSPFTVLLLHVVTLFALDLLTQFPIFCGLRIWKFESELENVLLCSLSGCRIMGWIRKVRISFMKRSVQLWIPLVLKMLHQSIASEKNWNWSRHFVISLVLLWCVCVRTVYISLFLPLPPFILGCLLGTMYESFLLLLLPVVCSFRMENHQVF